MLVTDEPTSGLDSANAKGVVDALVRVARAGRVVIMSIHQVRLPHASCSSCRRLTLRCSPRLLLFTRLQPRSYIWGQFDSLLLLGKGGEVVYNGRRERCIDHFAELGYPAPTDYNPADFLLDMVAGLDPIEAARLENAGYDGRGRGCGVVLGCRWWLCACHGHVCDSCCGNLLGALVLIV